MKTSRNMSIFFGAIWAGIILVGQPLFAQDNQSYQMPPKEMTDILMAPLTPTVNISPNNDFILFLERSPLPTIEEMAQPELKIAGLRINPLNNGQSRVSTFIGLKMKEMTSLNERVLKDFPAGSFTDLRWSPDGKMFAFVLVKNEKLELWIADAEKGTTQKMLDNINDVLSGEPFQWSPTSDYLLVKTITKNRQILAKKNLVPTGPTIQENLGKKAPARTYQDLLKNAYDESLFDYHLSTDLVKISLKGELQTLLSNKILTSFSLSPNGKYIINTVLKKPYSYLVPYSNFPKEINLNDISGRFIKSLADIPLSESVPIGNDAVRTGMRSVEWRADAPETIIYVEAQDEGDPNKKVEVRDKIFSLTTPFVEPKLMASLSGRYRWSSWGNDTLAILVDGWWKNRTQRMIKINPSLENQKGKVIFDINTEDLYKDPGYPIVAYNKAGREVLLVKEQTKKIIFMGEGSSPEGKRPFVREVSLIDNSVNEIWRSEAPFYEMPIDVLDMTKNVILTRKESTTVPSNYFVKNLDEKSERQLTFFSHPYPHMKDVKKELLQYQRADGVKLTAKVYFPVGYSAQKGALPTLIWAYPREYKNANNVGQVKDSPYLFTRIGWTGPMYWLTQGYAVVDDPDLPIIGEGDKQPNDTYIEQLKSGAEALVNELVSKGIADKNRIAIGGHSYGAFMTANLLAHTSLFAVGIARSGAYNRTLTPFGFQSEERTMWEVPEIYAKMSPFNAANKIKNPLLIIHGEADNNAGTFPLQSERLYNAIKGHGGTTRFVLLPLESHGYTAKESILHTLWEMNQWMNKYMKPQEVQSEGK
ncbi:glutamyl peptidase [Arcicella aurantiaca]|uniref:Glutamyl peptidase n=1 Tax=Arcicella aurantiaca TaxID=591202 RepID=A0A316DKH6_9BACT|nr:prolyl oligopeptidase family serine peptidase [Arcicella aurantiaca]PWK18068.1 glutamyl peptidase [Arcicella aurantiaca]